MGRSASTTALANGKQYVLNHLADYNLTTISTMNQAIADINTTAFADGVSKAKLQCMNDPSSCGIDIVANISSTMIDTLPANWTLIGTASDITDMSVFDNAKIIWIYTNGKWKAYSPNDTTKNTIQNASIDMITTIPANSGIWVFK